ncbi:hypothetical protein ACF09Y_17145 [Streptomyces massasporeus]|uniref:hypothetical protein n=1 Tax=Streptomyces massasporeus TaxID=67324 RepID=UPI0036FAB671
MTRPSRPAELLGGAQQLPVPVPHDRADGFLATRRRHDRNADLLGLDTVDVGHRLLVTADPREPDIRWRPRSPRSTMPAWSQVNTPAKQ